MPYLSHLHTNPLRETEVIVHSLLCAMYLLRGIVSNFTTPVVPSTAPSFSLAYFSHS